MFSKAFFVVFLYLSVTSTTFARPANDFHFGGSGGFGDFGGSRSGSGHGVSKSGSSQEQCATAVQTVTVTAAAAAASAAATSASTGSGSKGGDNSGQGGAAGNNNNNNNNNGNNGNSSGDNNNGSTSTSAAASSSTSSVTSSSAGNNSTGAQSSLTLDPSVIATGFEQNGQEDPTAGQVASLTSSNNFINFCLTVPNLPLTNGQQIKTGSCNPAPMGIIAATTAMPSSKFQFPTNFGTIQANTSFTVTMAINNLETGNFVNADENFFSAPQQVNGQGLIQGHSHVVIEAIDSITSTQPTDPTRFAFFKGLNDPAQNGVLTANVTAGLPAGTYRLASINTAANHQPVLVAIAQHGSLDDMVYFTVTDDGAPAASTAAASPTAVAKAGSKGHKN